MHDEFFELLLLENHGLLDGSDDDDDEIKDILSKDIDLLLEDYRLEDFTDEEDDILDHAEMIQIIEKLDHKITDSIIVIDLSESIKDGNLNMTAESCHEALKSEKHEGIEEKREFLSWYITRKLINMIRKYINRKWINLSKKSQIT